MQVGVRVGKEACVQVVNAKETHHESVVQACES